MTETFTSQEAMRIAWNSFLIGGVVGFTVCHWWQVRWWRKKVEEVLDLADSFTRAKEGNR